MYEYYWYKAPNKSWYIDEQGGIYSYSYSSGSKGFIRPPALIGQVAKKTLDQKRKLIERAAKGSFTERRGPTDSGSAKIAAFLRDPKSGKYRVIELSVTGNVVRINNASAARELLTWLRGELAKY